MRRSMTTNHPDNPHPLAKTLARMTAGNAYFYADMGQLDTGWFLATDLIQDGSAAFEQALAHQAIRHPHMEARTRGSYWIGEYSWYVPAVAVTAYLAERRVPDLSPDNLALRFSRYTWHEGGESGEAERLEVRFLSGRFAALPADPAASHPDAVIVPDTDALREWLRTSLEAHLTPLIERVHSRTRLGRHAQWCLVADSCAALFLHGGQALDDEPRGKAEGLAFVKAPGSPMKNPNTGYVSLRYLDHRETFRTRGGCCRYYTVAEDGYKCATCVLRKPEERDQLLLDYMARKYAKETAS